MKRYGTTGYANIRADGLEHRHGLIVGVLISWRTGPALSADDGYD